MQSRVFDGLLKRHTEDGDGDWAGAQALRLRLGLSVCLRTLCWGGLRGTQGKLLILGLAFKAPICFLLQCWGNRCWDLVSTSSMRSFLMFGFYLVYLGHSKA